MALATSGKFVTHGVPKSPTAWGSAAGTLRALSAPASARTMWSTPIPAIDLEATLTIGKLLSPVAAIAATAVLSGFGVIFAGIVEQVRGERSSDPASDGDGPASRS